MSVEMLIQVGPTILHRAGESGEEIDHFRQALSRSLLRLLPLAPLIPSAACVHWVLRIIATLTHPSSQREITMECVSLLVGLTRELQARNTLAAQLLQTQ